MHAGKLLHLEGLRSYLAELQATHAPLVAQLEESGSTRGAATRIQEYRGRIEHLRTRIQVSILGPPAVVRA